MGRDTTCIGSSGGGRSMRVVSIRVVWFFIVKMRSKVSGFDPELYHFALLYIIARSLTSPIRSYLRSISFQTVVLLAKAFIFTYPIIEIFIFTYPNLSQNHLYTLLLNCCNGVTSSE